MNRAQRRAKAQVDRKNREREALLNRIVIDPPHLRGLRLRDLRLTLTLTPAQAKGTRITVKGMDWDGNPREEVLVLPPKPQEPPETA